MTRQDSGDARQTPGAREGLAASAAAAKARSLKERVGALRHLKPFVAMVWRTSPSLTAASVALRSVRALRPVATLYVGKLIIDEVVMLVQVGGRPDTLADWLASGLLERLALLIA